MQAPTKDQLKERAKHLCEIMLDKYGVKVSHGHSLEIISKLFGFKDWNTVSASTTSKASENTLPMNIETVEDMKGALALFKDTNTIDADFEFKIKDVLENLEESDSPEDTIHQTFALRFESVDGDIASLKLELKNEDLYSSEENGFSGRSLR